MSTVGPSSLVSAVTLPRANVATALWGRGGNRPDTGTLANHSTGEPGSVHQLSYLSQDDIYTRMHHGWVGEGVLLDDFCVCVCVCVCVCMSVWEL